MFSNDSLRELFITMVFIGAVKDVLDIIFKYSLHVTESHHTNEERSSSRSRLSNWDQLYTKTFGLYNNCGKHFFEDDVLGAASHTIGPPIHMFTLEQGNYKTVHGRALGHRGLYFAINCRDNGINARMTHSIPSAMRNLNQLGIFNRIVGYSSEPIEESAYPHWLSLSDWTVFRVQSDTLVNSTAILWFTFFSASGFIASRPFTYAEGDWIDYPKISCTDIASVDDYGITILGNQYNFEELRSWLK